MHFFFSLFLSSMWMLKAANIFFFVFHVALILFNVFGWIFPRFRKWHLITLGLTAFSWIILGYFYGWGYCFVTDWHWEVRNELGYPTESSSYIHFLITSLLPVTVSEALVNRLTGIVFGAVLILSIYVNIRNSK